MKKILISVILISLVGCATIDSVDTIQSQIDELKTPIQAIAVDSAVAKSKSLEAATTASFANYYAVMAEKQAELTQFKLDMLVSRLKVFKR